MFYGNRCCPRTKMRADDVLPARFCIFLLTNPHFLRMIKVTLKIVSNWLRREEYAPSAPDRKPEGWNRAGRAVPKMVLEPRR